MAVNPLEQVASWFACVSLVLVAGCQADVAGPNRPPVAVAGEDQVVEVGDAATLDGSRSYDPDGDLIHMEWKIVDRPAGAAVGLSAANGTQVTLAPDQAGTWVVTLTASDTRLASTRDVVRILAIQACQVDADCDDENVCTDDTCGAGGRCVFAPNSQPCDDFDACTTADACSDGACVGTPRDDDNDGHGSIACGGDDCDDANAGVHPGVFEGPEGAQVCSDGLDNDCDGETDLDDPGCLPCTQDSDCDDSLDCTQDTCDLVNQACVHSPDNAACDDGLYCNGVETCDPVQGCQAGTAVGCDDGLMCTLDACDEDLDDCSHTPDDGLCADGLVCNGDETCDPVAGCQAGSPPVCDDQLACTHNGCDEGAGGCNFEPDDLLCDDGNPCTDGTCDPVAGCQYAAGNNGTACSVGACDGTCEDGLCLGCTCNTPTDCDDGIPCTIEACNNGACSYTPDDGVCDDGAFCNGAETCSIAAGCRAGTAPDCDDSVGCTLDSCDEANDRCSHVPTNSQCDDGLWCNGAETCDAVLGCQPGVAQSCGDAFGCTIDACDENTDQCTHTPDDGVCDDGAWCNGAETCNQASGCQSGLAPNCNDQVGCTVDSCDEGNDQCAHAADDGPCDDGLWCNGAETCDAVQDCQAGTAPDCDDSVGCTADSCNESTDQCDHQNDDSACDDGAFCNGAEYCDKVLDCQVGADPCPGQSCDEGLDQCVACTGDPDCDDGNFCNGAESCLGGACQPGSDMAPGDYCDGGDLVTCDGSGNETASVTCALGCTAATDPDRCLQVDPSNLDPALLCANPFDLTINGPVEIDTDLGTITGVNDADIVFTQVNQGGGAPAIGVFSFNNIDIQADVTVTGNNALALLACEDAQIAALITSSPSGRTPGPGGYSGGDGDGDGSGYSNGEGLVGYSDTGSPYRETGGGGGGFGFIGGDGGDSNPRAGGAGGQVNGTDALVPLVGGSGGGSGGYLPNLSDNGGLGGGGGGAVQISAGADLLITAAGGVQVGGAGGAAGPAQWASGGGGGAGGAILLEGATVTVDGTLAANGGGGGGGDTSFDSACAGGDPEAGQDGPYGNSQAAGGRGCDTDDRDAGPGGAGGYGGAATGAGVQPADYQVSGGGGGAAGRVRANTALGAASINGVVSPNAASGAFTQGTVSVY